MDNDNRGYLTRGLDDAAYAQKSPMMQGIASAAKGLLLGAGAGSLINAARGASASHGALIGGLGVALLSGLATAAKQEVENTNTEAAMRYHLTRIGDREPMIFMPPPKVFGPLFSRLHAMAHRKPPEGQA